MKNILNEQIVEGKKIKIYTEGIKELLNKSESKIIYDDVYKINKKISFHGIDERETLYIINEDIYYLYITVPKDSYLSQIGVEINKNECIFEMDADAAITYLECRVATDVILKHFSNKLIWDKLDDIKTTSCCYVKNKKIYDLNQSVSIKLFTDRYVRFGEEINEYEELYIKNNGELFLYLLYDSVRASDSNLYFRNKDAAVKKMGSIYPMTEAEAISWFLLRGGNLEEFYISLEKAKKYLSQI